MFKRLLNECKIELTLKPEGALLIKSGIAQLSGIDMAWVKVFRNGMEEVFLPGSSLKGTMRSHAERIARTVNDFAACNPFGTWRDKALSCSAALEVWKRKERMHDLPTPLVYKHSCPICRMFGNTFVMGRFATEDAYAVGEPPRIQQRDGVGIDRFTGGASRGAKFELEVITSGEFKTFVHLQNFELWQLGLLGFVLQDLRDGLVRMGSGKSRGLGKVRAEMKEEAKDITLHYIGAKEKMIDNGKLNLLGVGALFAAEAEAYGFAKDDRLQVEIGQAEIKDSPFAALRQTATFAFDAFPWQQVAKIWKDYAEGLKQDPLHVYRKGEGR